MCLPGSMRTTVLPMRAACTAAATPAGGAAVDDDVVIPRRSRAQSAQSDGDEREQSAHDEAPERWGIG